MIPKPRSRPTLIPAVGTLEGRIALGTLAATEPPATADPPAQLASLGPVIRSTNEVPDLIKNPPIQPVIPWVPGPAVPGVPPIAPSPLYQTPPGMRPIILPTRPPEYLPTPSPLDWLWDHFGSTDQGTIPADGMELSYDPVSTIA